jgi:hypothetical protein
MRLQPAKHLTSRTPVLVELFTSEGCSSCPSADKLLAQLQKDQPVAGALIIPLSEHVDYWDGAHWKDQFSSPLFTARQNDYVRSLKVDSPYTPQMVVDGHSEFVGSDEDSAAKSIAHAAKVRKAKVNLAASFSQTDIVIGVKVKSAIGIKGNRASDVFVAVTENNLSSHVLGGENSGRQLRHTAVVRSLRRVGSINGVAPYEYSGKLRVDPKWKAKDLSVVVFIQSRDSLQILGSAIAWLK